MVNSVGSKHLIPALYARRSGSRETDSGGVALGGNSNPNSGSEWISLDLSGSQCQKIVGALKKVRDGAGLAELTASDKASLNMLVGLRDKNGDSEKMMQSARNIAAIIGRESQAYSLIYTDRGQTKLNSNQKIEGDINPQEYFTMALENAINKPLSAITRSNAKQLSGGRGGGRRQ